jgi:tRNA 5-methylaminomethyl-2-thiouridine biosynthesis bifunctional protein
MTDEARNKKARVEYARLDWDAGAPRSVFFDDIYFSGDGADEAEHVFLRGNNLAARFASARLFAVGELGFGTGLNFLKTWELWDQTLKPAGARLRYFSVEKFPMSAEDLARAHRAWPALDARAARLRALLPPPVDGYHQLNIAPDISLILAFGEAEDMLARAEACIDAWFFDGFSPAKSPDMWSTEIFAEAARLSRPGATFATFTVAGSVRRALAAAGFTVEKRPGFGRKKEMLAGDIEAPPARSKRAPWFQNARPRPLEPGARIAIIGGGIAGASLAHEAARAGLVPTIIESQGLAAGASGNPAGLVMPRLDLGETPAARFFLSAYLHTVRLLTDLAAAHPGESRDPELTHDWIPASAGMIGDRSVFNQCGVILGAGDDKERERQKKLLAEAPLPEGWMEARAQGLFFPQAGVVDPAKFVTALAGGAERVMARATKLVHDNGGVAIEFDNGSRRGFDAVVLANGVAALDFVEARALPLSAVAGQVDWFEGASAPPHAIAFGPYAATAPKGGLIIGATYEKVAPRETPTPSRAATETNIEAVRPLAPEIAVSLDPNDARSRASLRCQTPDRLPLAGTLPDLGFYGAAYDDLRLGVKKDYPPGEMTLGAYILSGLGSRGLVTAPLTAAMIIAEMTSAPAPLDYKIAEALHPARFFIRDLKRARTVRKA